MDLKVLNKIMKFMFLALPKLREVEKVVNTHHRRFAQEMEFDLWKEPEQKPIFTFKLRPRLIMSGNSVKLLCLVSGNPTPTVQWTKSGNPIDNKDPHYNIENSTGVCILEISSCEMSDTGYYKCYAENSLGFDETISHITIEGEN